MIKKIIALFACILFSTPILAETYFRVPDTNVLEVSVKRYFSTQEQQESVLQKYRDLLTKNNNYGLLAVDIWQVCVAGGLDITQLTGKENCVQFVNALVSIGDSLFFSVCDSKIAIDEDKRDISKCEADFFNYTNVQFSSAIALSKLYAKEKYNDEIICSTKYRKAGNDDFVQCKSLNTGAFYEFKFDDVRESIDETIQINIVKAVCGIYGATQFGTTTMGKTQCKATEEQCLKVKNAYKTLIDSVEINYLSDRELCEINFGLIKEAKDLKTACDIDSFAFCRDTQFNTQLEFIEALKEYTARKCGTEMFNIHCDNSFKTYMGPGCKVSTMAPKDDIVSCYFGDQQIDYVFDDVNEFSKKRANAGMQSMSCILLDGTFDGKNCVGLGKEECELLANQGEVDCPDCKGIRWDEDKGLCILPDAKNLTNGEKVLKIAGVTGAVVVAVASSVISAGAAAPGAWAVVAKIGTGLVIAGGVTTITAEAVESFGIFEPFVKKANTCINSSDYACAIDLVTNELNRMQSYSEDLTDTEADALDKIFAKLLDKIPVEDPFWENFWGNPTFFDCPNPNDLSTCVAKEKIQAWQAVRGVGNALTMIGGLLTITSSIGTRFINTRDVCQAKILGHPRWGAKSPVVTIAQSSTRGRLATIAELGGMNNKAFIAKHGLKMGQTFMLNLKTGQVVTSVVASTGANLSGLVPMAVGAGDAIYHIVDDDTDFAYSKNSKSQTPDPVPTPDPVVTPDPDPVVTPDPVPVVTPDPDPVVIPTPVPVVIPTPVPVVTPTPVPVVTPDPVTVVTPDPNPVIDSTPDNRTITPYDVKKPKTGLIATAAVLGTVGTGFLVGGLLNRDKNDDAAQQNVITGSTVENEINTMLNNANSVIGVVGESQITLVPMATTVNTMSPIVNINNNAVVVVNYRGHKLPFFVGGVVGTWTPLLGIGQTGGWFNIYLDKVQPIYITHIQTLLNQKLAPTTVKKYIGVNSTGVQLPYVAPDAYSVINAEFPNGVVQKYEGKLIGSDKTLHDSNYNKIKAIK